VFIVPGEIMYVCGPRNFGVGSLIKEIREFICIYSHLYSDALILSINGKRTLIQLFSTK